MHPFKPSVFKYPWHRSKRPRATGINHLDHSWSLMHRWFLEGFFTPKSGLAIPCYEILKLRLWDLQRCEACVWNGSWSQKTELRFSCSGFRANQCTSSLGSFRGRTWPSRQDTLHAETEVDELDGPTICLINPISGLDILSCCQLTQIVRMPGPDMPWQFQKCFGFGIVISMPCSCRWIKHTHTHLYIYIVFYQVNSNGVKYTLNR